MADLAVGDAVSGAGDPALRWATELGDARLLELLHEALAGNLSLQAGLARLDQAIALARMEGASIWPTLGVNASGQRQRVNNAAEPPVSSVGNRYAANAVVQWELDIWGRLSAQRLAAGKDAAALARDYAALRLALATRVGGAWYHLIERRMQAELTEETVRVFEKSLNTVEERFERGLSPALDLRLTRANVLSVRATLVRQQRLLDEATRQLELLLGRYPQGELAMADRLPDLLQPLAAGMPANLLERRPDIAASRLRLEAADARLKQSRRALFPAISLTASYGRTSSELENLLKDRFDVWSLVGGLTQPLFQGGRLRANVTRSEARLREVTVDYEAVVLNAFFEVESALRNEFLLREQLMELQAAAVEAVGAQELAQERYERGLVDILTVLDSQRTAFNFRSAAISVQSELLQNRLSLYRAIGGDLN